MWDEPRILFLLERLDSFGSGGDRQNISGAQTAFRRGYVNAVFIR